MHKTYRKLAKPYIVWLYILAIVPIAVMFVLSFLQSNGVEFSKDVHVSLDAFSLLFDASTLSAFINSFIFSILTTLIAGVLGYILAYQIFRSKIKNKFLVLAILILPMWSNLLLRIESLGNLMQANNMISDFLSRIGIHVSLQIKGTPVAVLIGLVFTYLPFMVLPIYTSLEKIEPQLEEAALDLGLPATKKFWKVIFPLTFKGILSGSIMVFLPALSGFAIPQILSNGNIVLIGNIIEQSFKNMNYNFGSLLALILMFIILGLMFLIQKFDKEGETLL